jgi:hypothetical protein
MASQKLLHNCDWPEYVEPFRQIYKEDEIQMLLKACGLSDSIALTPLSC